MNEIKLIRQCQKGNKTAFNELINFYYPFVLKYLIKITNNEEIAKDLTQDTFLKFIRNVEKFDVKGKASFSTYLITISKNCYLDYLRATKKISNDIDLESIKDPTYLENEIILENNINLILTKINKLPFEQAEAMKLKYLEGYTLNEIAVIMKTKPQTVKSRLHDGKRKLRKDMKRKDDYFYE